MIYVGNDIGVFVSSDGGANWSQLSEGLPDAVIVMDLSISPKNRALRVVTHGNGVYETMLLESPTSVKQPLLTVENFRLEQNYPNPFNPITHIHYAVPKACHVSMKIYDGLGREIITLVNAQQSEGRHDVRFDGSGLACGVYIYELLVNEGEFVQAR